MDTTLSVTAIILAVIVGLWQWQVVRELRAIRSELESLRDEEGL